MYFQYRNNNNECLLISISNNTDRENDIYFEESNFIKIFPDWKEGDIVYISNSPLTFPIYTNNILREKTREELIIMNKMSHLIREGEYIDNGRLMYKQPEKDVYLPEWDWVLNEWVESSYAKTHYSQEIDILKAKILEDGFLYTDKLGKSYQQKTRDKDRSFLESSINTMIDSGINYIYWAFSNEIKNMTLDELKELRKQGFLFNQVVFKIEAYLKGLKPKNISIDEYRELVDKESIVKCWR